MPNSFFKGCGLVALFVIVLCWMIYKIATSDRMIVKEFKKVYPDTTAGRITKS